MIYIVDDDQSVRTNLARLMRSAGFSTRTFASAEEFLEAADNIEPGCLLLDVTLPGLSGLQLHAELNKRDINLPVIAVSAHKCRGLRSSCLPRDQMAAVLNRPVEQMQDAIQFGVVILVGRGAAIRV